MCISFLFLTFVDNNLKYAIMKKLLLALLLCLPLAGGAKERDDSKYLAGAVPEENGVVKFQQTFAVPGKTQQEIFQKLSTYVDGIVATAEKNPRTRIIQSDAATGELVARVEEWMEFKKKPLYWDRTRFRYQLIVQCSEAKCHIEVTQISYYYEEDIEGNNGRTFKAEEWITDKEALNKAQTKLVLGSAKFRRKTVDRVEQLFEQARNLFEEPVPETKRATQIIKE